MTKFAGPPPGRIGAGAHAGTGSRKPSLRKAFVAFEHRPFRFLWLSGAASFLGMQMMIIGRGALAWDLSHSYAVTGLLSLAFGLPMLCFSLFGGATADRVEKRSLVVFIQLANAVSAGVIAILVATGVITIPILFVLGLLQGTMFAFMGPARTALLSDVVPREQFMNAIALNTAAMSTTTVLGPMVAGLLILVGGHEAAFGAMAVFGVISALLLSNIQRGTSHILAEGQVRQGMMAEVREGLAYVFHSQVLRVLFLMAIVPAVLAMPYQMLLPGFADDDLGKEWVYPAMLTVAGVGAMTGSFVIAALNDYRRKPLLQWIVGLGMGGSLIALGVMAELFGAAGALSVAVLLGFTMTSYQTLNSTLFMTATRPQYMGRVMSIMMLAFSAMPVVALPLGAVADAIGATTLFMIMGALILVAMAFVALRSREQVFGEGPPPEAVGGPSPAEDLGGHPPGPRVTTGSAYGQSLAAHPGMPGDDPLV